MKIKSSICYTVNCIVSEVQTDRTNPDTLSCNHAKASRLPYRCFVLGPTGYSTVYNTANFLVSDEHRDVTIS
jgi:hypothetical protein